MSVFFYYDYEKLLISLYSNATSPDQTDVEHAEQLFDTNGVPILKIKNHGKQRHPGGIAIYALAYAGLEPDILHNSNKDLNKFSACIDWLVNNLQKKPNDLWVWEYHFDNIYNDVSIKAPWASTFAQAVGIQALLTSYRLTGIKMHLDLAIKAAKVLFVPIKEGGLLFQIGEDIWFEEIPNNNPSHILNGHMRTLLALYELAELTDNSEIKKWLKLGTDTLYRWLPLYDAGYWLRYDLNPRKKELLFRIANPYGFESHALLLHKIILRDPIGKNEYIINVGMPNDTEGENRIAGIHWSQPKIIEGKNVRALIPNELENKSDELASPHTYFYFSLPAIFYDKLRSAWYELIFDYYDDAAANLTVQMRSIAPGQTFRNLRDGDLYLSGSKQWRRWIIPVRPTDLGFWVGMSYAEKHYTYLEKLSAWDKRFKPWALVAKKYLNLSRLSQFYHQDHSLHMLHMS